MVNFRLVYDKETGKPKGFGFAEFIDADAAASAVRNLNDYEMMGRKLRVDYSNDGGSHETQSVPTNYSAPVPPSNGSDLSAFQQMSNQPILPPLPPGTDVPPNLLAIDVISTTLKTLPPAQLLDILTQMKNLVQSDPTRATELLRTAPQLSYAIFQSLLLLGLVNQDVLASVLENINAPAQPQVPVAPTPLSHLHTPSHGFQQGIQYTHHQIPMPQHAQAPFQAAQPQPPAGADRDDLIRQILSFPQEEIDKMAPAERAQVMMLRQQFGGR